MWLQFEARPGTGPRPARNVVRVLPIGRQSTCSIKDLEIEYELGGMGVEMDFDAEMQRAEVGFGEV